MVTSAARMEDAVEAAEQLGLAAAAGEQAVIVLRAGEDASVESIGVPTGRQGLSVLATPSGGALRRYLDAAGGYDLVVLAVPSPSQGPEAITAARRVDAAVLVATARDARAAEVGRAAHQLREAGATVTAAILLEGRLPAPPRWLSAAATELRRPLLRVMLAGHRNGNGNGPLRGHAVEERDGVDGAGPGAHW
jgi:hypothetical protein